MRNLDQMQKLFKPRFSDNLFVQALQPIFSPRGGLGLVVQKGAASFRSATVTPLPGSEDKR